MESQILQVTLHSKPAAARHWSTRTLAEHLCLGATNARHAGWFKLSRAPRFEDKLLDVVGLYLNWCSAAMRRARSRP